MIENFVTNKSLPQKGVTFKQHFHHLRLLWQYWLVKEEGEQFASYNGKRAVVKQTPHVFERDWELLLEGKKITVDSEEIKVIYGSFELYGK